MGKREANKQEKRNLILSSAKRLFIQDGFQSVSISDIIRDTKLARGTFYLYFKNKEEIFDYLMGQAVEHLSKHIYAQAEVDGGSFQSLKAQLKENTLGFLKALKEEQEMVKLILTSPRGINSVFQEKIEKYLQLVIEVVAMAYSAEIEKKRVKKIDSHLFSYLLVGGMKEVIFEWIINDNFQNNIENIVDDLIEVYLVGVGISS